MSLDDELRQVMRHWVTGVSVATSQLNGLKHGMTVNSFTSMSLDPPLVSLTLASHTRTHEMVLQSGIVAVTILNQDQAEISDRFAGRIPESGNRFTGLETFTLVTGAPLITAGIGFVDGRIRQSIPLPNGTLFLVEVLAALPAQGARPLIYFNRDYHRLPDET